MSLADYQKAIERLLTWVQRSPLWVERWSAVTFRHIGGVPEILLISEDRYLALLSVLGSELMATTESVIVEDFFTHQFAPKGDTVIDAYLDKAGAKENAVTRPFLLALRNSDMRFYEIQGAEAGKHWLIREKKEGAEPFPAIDPQADAGIEPGSHMGARMLTLDGQRVLADGVYFYPPEDTDDIVAMLKAEQPTQGVLRTFAKTQGVTVDETNRERLTQRLMPTVFTQAWLLPILEDALADEELTEALDAALKEIGIE
ncbi:MAG: hypothetical protein H7338_23170 [Candidatus Sericytochromatia bacterium]|nr:hypothetical protein [Candidatus Sericytochromatia bacterium]